MIIKKGISEINNTKIWDQSILRLVGINTYCSILSIYPDLYQKFYECQFYEEDKHNIIHLNLYELNIDPIEIKKQLLLLVYEDNTKIEQEIHEKIRELKHSSKKPNVELLRPQIETYILIFILIIIVSFTFLGCLSLGLLNPILKSDIMNF